MLGRPLDSSRDSTDQQPLSPCLAEVAARVSEGDTAAIDRFWREVAVQGTPLVEPIEKDPENFLVTFLFRHGPDVRNVVVFPDQGLWGDIPSNRMERLAGTDIWHRTFRFRGDARFTYLLSVNDSLTPVRGLIDVEAWVKRSAAWRLDPLNPRRLPSYPQPLSVVELPDAPAQPYVSPRPDVPKGKVEAHKIKSPALGGERSVWIYTPAGYENEGPPCGLLVLFDGATYISWIPTPTILDNLLADHRIPPLLAVLVGQLPGLRDSDLTCSDPFTKFLVEELLSWVRSSYRVTKDPALAVVGGSSYGGLAAAYAAYRHPGVFGNVLSQSGGFMYSPPGDSEPDWLARQLAASSLLPIRFYLNCGLMEDQPLVNGTPNIVTTNRRLRDVLLTKGYRVHYREFNGGHEYLNWRGFLADGLIALVGDTPGR